MNKKVWQIALLITIIVAGFIAVPNATKIGDTVYFWFNEPSTRAEEFANSGGMNELGSRLFIRFNPQFVSEGRVKDVCTSYSDPVGCVSGSTIYIVKPETEAQKNQAIVTSAHEMLHVAYYRLNNEEKQSVDKAIQELWPKLDAEIVKEIALYEDQGEEVLIDEAHSIIGSEVENLPEQLETHYSKYFSNRQKSVEAYTKSN